MSAVRLEAVDGDRRVVVEFPADVTSERAACHAGLFRDIAEQMYRSGRAERARLAGRVVGEAGTREDPTVDRGATSPTTEHEQVVGPMWSEPVVVEDLAGPAVEPAPAPFPSAPAPLATVVECGHWSGLIDDGKLLCVARAGHDGDHWDDLGNTWSDQVAADRMVIAAVTEPVLSGPCGHSSGWKPFGAGVDGPVVLCTLDAGHDGPHDGDGAGAPWSTGAGDKRTARLRPHTEPEPVQPGKTGRGKGDRYSPEARAKINSARAAEKADRMGRFVAGFEASTGRSVQDQMRDAAKAAGITVGTASHYLREARAAGLLPDTLRSMAKAAGPIGKLPVPEQREPDRSKTVVQSHRPSLGFGL